MTDDSIAQAEPVLVAIDIANARHEILIAVPVQLKISAGQRFERDPVSHFNIATPSQIRTPSCQCPDQLHACHIAQKIT